MKIQQHPRMKDILVGDEVMCYRTSMYARVEEVFPAAVCVKIGMLCRVRGRMAVVQVPQLWRADDVENLSLCHYCGSREDLIVERGAGVPLRVCNLCLSVLEPSLSDEIAAKLPTQ